MRLRKLNDEIHTSSSFSYSLITKLNLIFFLKFHTVQKFICTKIQAKFKLLTKQHFDIIFSISNLM